MDYLNQLLESYSRLKKRKLVLLEAVQLNAKAKSLAMQYVSQAKVGAQTGAKVPIKEIPGASVWVAVEGKAQGQVVFDGFPGPRQGKGINIDPQGKAPGPQNFNDFVSLLTGDEEPNQPELQANQPNQLAGQSLSMSPQMVGAGDALGKAMKAFENIQLNAQAAYDKISKKFREHPTTATPDSFVNWLVGGDPKSLEGQITMCNTVVFDVEDNIIGINPGMVNPELVANVAESLDDVIRILGKSAPTREDLDDVMNKVRINTDGTISVFSFSKAIPEGMAFTDRSGSFKNFLNAFEDKYKNSNFKLAVNTIAGEKTTGADNRIRGDFLEKIPTIVSILNNCNPGTEAICQSVAKSKLLEFAQGIEKIIEVNQAWSLLLQDDQAVQEQDRLILDTLKKFLGENNQNSIVVAKAIVKLSKMSMKKRKAGLIINKGKQTKNGIRHDTFEVWKTQEEAEQALINSGYTINYIKKHGLIKRMEKTKAFDGDPELLKVASGYGNEVFMSTVSYKHSLELNEAKMGDLSHASIPRILGEKPDSIETANFQKAIKENLNMSDEDVLNVAKYTKHIEGVKDTVFNLPDKATVTDKNQKTIKVNSLDHFVGMVEETMRKHYTQDDMKRDDILAVASVLKKYVVDRRQPGTNKELNKKVRKYACTLLQNHKLISDIRKGLPEAKNYLAAKLFACAGSTDNGLICDYRKLYSGESYSFRQNEVLRNVINDWMGNSGNWKLKASGNTFIWENATNPEIKLTLRDSIKKSKEGIDFPMSSAELSKEAILHFDKSKNTLNENLARLLANQAKLIEEILNTSNNS